MRLRSNNLIAYELFPSPPRPTRDETAVFRFEDIILFVKNSTATPVLNDRAAFCLKASPANLTRCFLKKIAFKSLFDALEQNILNKGLVKVKGCICFKLKAPVAQKAGLR